MTTNLQAVVCRRLLLWLFLFILFSQIVKAQSVSISGTVKDDRNQVLSNVTIRIKGKNITTLSDADGNFNIKAPGTAVTLVFSYLRFPRKEVVTASDNHLLVIIPTQDTSLEGVVVIGYGVQKKSSILGAVSTVNAKDIERAPGTNLAQEIVGKLPGLVFRQESGQPGDDAPSLYVRGFSSLNTNSPLVLIDGIERSMGDIDPNEVETVTILKDASSAAVYGVRGANGVILITTKRGKSIRPTLTYSSSYTLSENTRMPQYLNGEEFVKWYNYADEINGRTQTFPDSLVTKVSKGDPNGVYGNTDWLKLMIKSSTPTIKENLSLQGGDQNIKYFMSVGYQNQQGIIKGVDYSRYNLRSNLDANVTKDVYVSLDLSGFLSVSHSPQIANFTNNGNSVTTNLMNQIIMAHPYMKPMKDGLYLSSSLLPGDNPLAARDLSGYNNSDNTGFTSNLSLQYKVPYIKGLAFKVIGSYDRNYYHTKSYYTPYTLWTADPTTGSESLSETAAPYGTVAILAESYEQTYRWTTQEYISYDQTFNKHTIGALIVGEQSSYNYTDLGATAQNFDLTDLSEFSYAKDNPNKPTGGSGTTNRTGFVGRFNYQYDNRYLAEFSGRMDASTNFPKNNRWGFFPSLSLGWHISEESFFKQLHSPITNLKLTGSYGILGNDATGSSYAYLSFMTLSTSPVANIGGSNVNGLLPTSYPNTDLTWEKSRTSNVGLQFELYQGLISGEFNYFYKITDHILTTVSSTYPPSDGSYYPSTVNSGKVDNRGFEFSLTHKSHIGKFNYAITGTLSWSHNRILNMDESVNLPEYESLIGRSMGAKTGLIALGLFKSDAEALASPTVSSTAEAGDIKYKDLNGDGKISYDQDVTIIGKSSYPELNYGINFTSSWKSFEFSFLWQGAAICDNALMGYYDGIGWDDTQFTRAFYNSGNSPKYLIAGSWTPKNPNGKYPRLDNQWRANNNWASTMWIVNGAYLRLKNVQLAYNIASKKGNPFNAQLYIAGMNLLTFSAFKYLDPEAPNVSNGYYPQQKTYSMGLRLIF